jgi:hypothetical protein
MSYIGENTDKRLNLLPGVNLAASGQTLLFTVPSGKSCIVTDVRFEVAQATAVISVASVRVGKASNYDEWLPITALTGLDVVGEFVCLSTASNLLVRRAFGSGDAIKMDVTTAAVATALTVNVHVFGYLY